MMSQFPKSQRSRPRTGATRAMAIALLAVVTLAGVGLGFAADRLALHSRRGEGGARRFGPGFGPPVEGHRGWPGGDMRRANGMRERFAHELDLSPEQAERVDNIMTQQTEDFRRLREQMQPRFDSLLAQAQARIDSVLTPGQREKLKTLRAREVFGPRDSFGARDHHLQPPR